MRQAGKQPILCMHACMHQGNRIPWSPDLPQLFLRAIARTAAKVIAKQASASVLMQGLKGMHTLFRCSAAGYVSRLHMV